MESVCVAWDWLVDNRGVDNNVPELFETTVFPSRV